jgi:hypothetical protein
MATSAPPREETAATDLEGRAGVESLDQLLAQRRTKVREYAPLAAKFKGGSGAGSSSDSARKRHRALLRSASSFRWSRLGTPRRSQV